MAKIVIRKKKQPAKANYIDKKAFMKEFDEEKMEDATKSQEGYKEEMGEMDKKRKKLRIYRK